MSTQPSALRYSQLHMRDPRPLLLEVLADLIRDAREQTGMSQRSAGEALFCSRRKITAIENGERAVDMIDFLVLMEAYDYDPAKFMIHWQHRYHLKLYREGRD